MYHSTERNERQGQRHALVLAVTLHLALVAVFYFKTNRDSGSQQPSQPAKMNVAKEQITAKAKTVQLP